MRFLKKTKNWYEGICLWCKESYQGHGQYFCSKSCKAFYFAPKLAKLHKGKHRSLETEFKKGYNPKKIQGLTKTRWGQIARKTLAEYYGKKDWRELCLPENPVLHHINGDITDNRNENLCVMTRSEHASVHYPDRLS